MSTRKCKHCPKDLHRTNTSGLCQDCLRKQQVAQRPEALVASDRERLRLQGDNQVLKKKYDAALKDIKRLETTLGAAEAIEALGVEPFAIEPEHGTGTSEGTVIAVASDWHVEERVDPQLVSGLNTYNTDIARERAETFFRGTLRLTNLLAQDIKIKNIVMPLLGDFISNQIHEDFAEINQLQPTHAIVFAQNLIIGGIEYILDNSDYTLIVPCHSGNHGRVTHKVRFGAENGHSLEYLMYLHMAAYFRGNDRVQFRISDGYHQYLEVYGQTIRLHHGHAINYQGGIGGIFIPAFKAISQWDKARRADLDIFGHFHQMKDGGKFVCNGSLIGYNSFALSIKADYEPPRQTMLLIDKKRGRTCTWPILFKR